MAKYLVTIEADYADEFYVSAYAIMKQNRKDIFEKNINGLTEAREIYFGTNESIEVTKDDYEIKEITDEEATMIANVVGSEFGHTELIDTIFDL